MTGSGLHLVQMICWNNFITKGSCIAHRVGSILKFASLESPFLEGIPQIGVRPPLQRVQVFSHRSGKEEWLLRDDGQVTPELHQVEGLGVDAVDRDPPGVDVERPKSSRKDELF